MTSIAFCIPTTPWIKERRAAMARLELMLGLDDYGDSDRIEFPDHYLKLTDKAPNQVWSVTMWKWMLETRADFCLTLQDDVLVSPDFWRSLRAMLHHLPRGQGRTSRAGHILGLSGVHPIAAEIARRGHRWYRTTSWVIGWAYGMWREDLAAFYAWRTSPEGELTAARIAPMGEDVLINMWSDRTGRDVWHPVPAICDHDVSLESSYDNDDHGHRRPWVTWRDRAYQGVDLGHHDFWLVNGAEPQHFHTVAQHLCSWCLKNKPTRRSVESRLLICEWCIKNLSVSLFEELAQARSQPVAVLPPPVLGDARGTDPPEVSPDTGRDPAEPEEGAP
jgi:hypothetical protein